MLPRRTFPLVLAGLFAGPATAQEPTPAAPTPKERRVYSVRHGQADAIAETLAKLYQGSEGVQVLADRAGNQVLVSAPPAALPELMTLLEKLDRRPRAVAVDLLVVEVLAPEGRGEQEKEEKPPDARDFTGPAEKVLAKVEALRKGGRLGEVRRLHLSAVEGHPSTAQVGGQSPVVTGVQNAPGGIGRRGPAASTTAVSYMDTGVQAEVTVAATAGDVVVLDLNLSETGLREAAGVVLGAGEDGAPVRAAERATLQFRSRLQVPSGAAVAAQGASTGGKSVRSQTWVIVAARLAAPDA
ncbi:MAG TPA: secretin N-terminal domain-containing protein [Gemmataceae bacterium]